MLVVCGVEERELGFVWVVSALVAYGIDVATHGLFEMRAKLLARTDVTILQFFIWLTYYMLLAMFALVFTHYVAPKAIGSGIPEVKTVLKGFDLGEYFSMRVFVAKWVGMWAAVSSGLPIGQEGPFVHMAAIISHQLLKIPFFRRIGQNEARRLQMLAAAAAVGVSCNFGAPIGGVLFSIEVTAYVSSRLPLSCMHTAGWSEVDGVQDQ